MTLNEIAAPGGLIPKPALAAELGISSRTVSRWMDDAEMAFPRPVKIRGRNYYTRSAIEAWKMRRLRVSMDAR